jgi:hypothetical protein
MMLSSPGLQRLSFTQVFSCYHSLSETLSTTPHHTTHTYTQAFSELTGDIEPYGFLCGHISFMEIYLTGETGVVVLGLWDEGEH